MRCKSESNILQTKETVMKIFVSILGAVLFMWFSQADPVFAYNPQAERVIVQQHSRRVESVRHWRGHRRHFHGYRGYWHRHGHRYYRHWR